MAPKEAVARQQQQVRALVALPRFTCETTCYGFCLVLVELGVTATFFSLYGLAQVHKNLYMTCGIIGVVSVGAGFFGLCRSTPAAVTSLILSVGVSFASTLLGGLCIVLAFDVPSAVASFMNKSLLPVPQNANKKLIRDTTISLAVAASVLLTSAGCHALLARHLNKLVGPRRGAIAFLQTFSLIVIPFSLFLVLGGQYIADSGTLASAPYTGIIVFGCGTLLLVIAVLAFIGGTFEYRRLLSLCVMLSYVTATLLVGISIAYFALRSRVEAYILEHWELLRVVLPPTFQARYDRKQFVALVQGNLQTVAYLAIVCGLFTFQTAGVCIGLMNHATVVKRQLAHDKQAIRGIESQRGESSGSDASSTTAIVKPEAEAQVLQRHAWRSYFEASKRRQRILMRVFAFLFVVAVALILAVMTANVVFATKCHSIGKLVQEGSYPIFPTQTNTTTAATTAPTATTAAPNATNSTSATSASSAMSATNATSATISAFDVTNRFARGLVSIRAATTKSGTVRLEQHGNAERSKAESFVQSVRGSTLNIEARPFDVTRFLWLDGSCQRSVLDVELPTDKLRELYVRSNASVDIRGGASGPSLPFRTLSVETDQANVVASQLLVREGGLALASASGEIDVSDTMVNGTSGVGVDTRANVRAALGSLRADNVTFADCDATFETGAGTLELTRVVATTTAGRSHVRVASKSGAVFVDVLRANWLELVTTDGAIAATALRTTGSSAFMGRLEVASVSGDVTLQQLEPRGSVRVETASGNIKMQIQTLAFTGLYYLHSDFGNVTIRNGLYGTDTLKATPVTVTGGARELQGGVNCDPATPSCLSYGDLYLYSRLGDIEVVLGCDSFQCV